MPAFLVGLALVAAFMLLARKIADEKPALEEKKPPPPGDKPPPATAKPTPATPTKKRTGKLNDDLLAAALAVVPPGTVLHPVLGTPDPVLDPVYGGRKPDMNGAPAWAYYQMILGKNPDGSVRKGGTTCVITLTYFAALAGWPKEMINREPTDQWATGGGFTPGSMKFLDVAKKRSWYKSGAAIGDWQATDAYHIDHVGKPNSDHVGLVETVSDPAADGTRQIGTIDGGQGTGADIQRNTRTLSADGKTLTLNSVPARVLGVIRADAPASA